MIDTFLFVSSDHGQQSEMENLMYDLDTNKRKWKYGSMEMKMKYLNIHVVSGMNLVEVYKQPNVLQKRRNRLLG